MKHSLTDAQFFSLPGGTKGWLYPAGPDNAFSIAVVTMDGVYPQQGWSINDVCTETMYVQKGRLKAEIGEVEFALKKGDVLSIPPHKKYRVRGRAVTIDVITPAWDKKQNQIIKD